MKIRSSALSLAAVLALTACGAAANQPLRQAEIPAANLTPIETAYSSRDISGAYDSNTQNITLSGESVTISQAGTYILSGTLTNGQVIINAGDIDKVQLVLNGAAIACADAPAILAQNADKVFITLAEGTNNTVSDGTAYTNTDWNGCIHAECDLTINGSGALTVNGNYKHGIYTKDDFTMTGGTLAVTAKANGINGKDAVQIKDGKITITADGDGIQSDKQDNAEKGYISIDGGTINITADEDGIQAETRLQVCGGTVTLLTGGGSANGRAHNNGFGRFGGGQPPALPDGAQRPEGNPPEMPDGAQRPEGNPPEMPDGTQRPAGNPLEMPGGAQRSDGQQPPAMPDGTQQQAQTTTEETVSSKGLKSAGTLLITGGTITADCADDAIHTNGIAEITGGTMDLSSGDDGIHADDALFISGGSITIPKSYEGLEGHTVTITGGQMNVTASDDGINAAGGSDGTDSWQDMFTADENAFIRITGGTVTVSASGDGIDSNGNLYVDGGTVYVSGPTDNGNGALDYEGEAVITGGIVIAAGSRGMAMGFSENSTQYSFLTSLPQTAEGNTALTVTDSSGKTLATFTPPKAYQSVCASLPTLQKGGTYTIKAGSQQTTVTLDSIAVNEGGGFSPGHHGGGNRPR